MHAVARPDPEHARAAPTHPDPYPWYGRLARGHGFFHDDTRHWWVAASAAAVDEVLASPHCLTRPLSEPIPEALGSGAAATLFARLVRQRDDAAGALTKRAIDAALRGLDPDLVSRLCRERAAELDTVIGLPLDGGGTTHFAFSLPAQVLARLLGLPRDLDAQLPTWIGAFGAAAAAAGTGIPAPEPALVAHADQAAQALLDRVGAVFDDPRAHGPLMHAIVREGSRGGVGERLDLLANTIGCLIQAHAATASLIGLSLLALARRPELAGRIADDRGLLRSLIQEVLRCDPPTNSTFRFMARDALVCGQRLRAGEMIIVLLAAASRDPALNAQPDRFDIARSDRRLREFGAGAHACPADKLAPLIAQIALDHLLDRAVPLERLETALAYAASGHIRTPLFTHARER